MRGRMMSLLTGCALALVLTAPAVAQDPAPDLEEIFSPWATLGLDPLGEATPEDVPVVPQPDYFRQPLFKWYFGSGLATGTGRASVALGAGPNGLPRVYVATTNDRVQMFDATSPGASLGSFGSFQDAAGIAYYRGKVYVVDRRPAQPDLARIEVFNAAGSWLRTIPLINPAGLADMTGIDIVGGEIWVTGAICGGFAGIVQILDAETGALKGIAGHVAHTPTGDPAKPCDEAWDASAWWDISVVPEFEAAIAEYRLLHRNIFAALTIPDHELECARCYRKLWQDGTDGVWGMRWLLVVDGDSRTSRGTGVTEYGIDPTAIAGEPYLIQRRLWAPRQATSGGIRDIAYQNREVRIDWKGQLTEHEWQRGRRCIDEYDVSDADFYGIGAQGEYWHEQARGFKSIEMWLKRNTPGASYQRIPFDQTRADGTIARDLPSSTLPSGDMCIDTNRYASADYTLQLRAYVNPDPQTTATKTVTIDNPKLQIDHDLPTGELAPVARWNRDDVLVEGVIRDTHSGPRDGQIQIAPSGGGFAALCPRMPNPMGCTWRTRDFADGTYRLRADLRDLVPATHGGPNVNQTTELIAGVDNTPPSFTVTGDLADRADGAPVYPDDFAPLRVAASDATSGVVDVTVEIDGATASRAARDCPTGGCSITHDTVVRGADYVDGQHTLRVVVRDQAGHTGEQSWTVDFEHLGQDGATPTTSSRSAVFTAGLAPDSVQFDPDRFMPCTLQGELPNFDAYWLGEGFEGLPLVKSYRRCDSVEAPFAFRANFVTYIYGDCEPIPDGTTSEHVIDARCQPPLEIQSWPLCERNPAGYLLGLENPDAEAEARPEATLEVRGAPAAWYDDRDVLEVYTGTGTVVVFGHDQARMLRAAQSVIPAPAVGVPELPAMARSSLDNSLPAPIGEQLTGAAACNI